ncbi:hypothetical protein GCM10009665_09230 [Kitasatospora nipponensis]|uniref:DUF2867 domain-containing protein n=1 Tax=Kitasatospora nipponensis TaxID=258049 RepID=A0ABP4GI42_9ACTN
MDVSRAVPIPADSQIAAGFPRVDYRDAFAAALPPGAATDPQEWARRVFAQPPGWIGRLLRLRDTLVAPLGLRGAERRSAGPFPFPQLRLTEREVVYGKDDRHLDFRVSVHTGGGELTITTVVHWNNALGRAYFRPVRPFHRRIVRSLLRRAVTG